MVSGELKEVGILEILQALSGVGQAGTLRLENGDVTALFRIDGGYVVAAASPTAGRLGDRLVARGILAREALEAVMRVQRRKKTLQPIGALVVDLNLAPRYEVESELESHVRSVIADVIRWPSGSFVYQPSEHFDGKGLIPEGLRIDSLLVAMLTNLKEDVLEAAPAMVEEEG